MPSAPETTRSLRDVQREFARALRSVDSPAPQVLAFAATRGPDVAARLDVYRNNTRQFFRNALALTCPVVRRRVGDDFFRTLAEEYRGAHPSRSGDLHWVGAVFPQWLSDRLAGTDYAWLGDLARLEWLCEESQAAGSELALTTEHLASVPADRLEALRVALQPSLRLLSSRYPLWSVWQANQGELPGAPVDLGLGPELCVIACNDQGATVYRLEPDAFRLLEALVDGASLSEALERAGVDAATLATLLGWAFRERLVVALSPSAPA